jgi:hypothetical protein
MAAVTKPWMRGATSTAAGDVPQMGTVLTWADRFGTWRARWSLGPDGYSWQRAANAGKCTSLRQSKRSVLPWVQLCGWTG